MSARKRNTDAINTSRETDENVPENKQGRCFQLRGIHVAAIFLFRCLNGLCLATSFAPDEYWQCLEIAHRLVYKYGYVTWEWTEGIRGAAHPLFFAGVYKALSLLSVDSLLHCSRDNQRVKSKFRLGTNVVVPRLVQGLMCAVGDIYIYRLAKKWFGSNVASWALLCSLLSWFHMYCGPRTLANSPETVLTTVALYYWHWPGIDTPQHPPSQSYALICAASACLLRPTSAVFWVSAASHYLLHTNHPKTFITETMVVGAVALLVSIVVDRLAYGRWVVVQWEFVRHNILNNVAVFYGSHPIHWYITNGIPTLLSSFLPLLALGIWHAPPNRNDLAWLALCVVAIYSALAHKEFRFIYPVLPIGLVYCGLALDRIMRGQVGRWTQFCVWVIFAVQLGMGGYFSLVHQRGVLDVMTYLRTMAHTDPTPLSVHFWLPCHSTPFYSHVHHNITMRILTCEPSGEANYVDEADVFFTDPRAWLETNYRMDQVPGEDWRSHMCLGPTSEGLLGICPNQRHRSGASHTSGWGLPTHVVMYDTLVPTVAPWLANHKYIQVESFFHTHLPEGRVGRRVVVYKWQI